MYTYIIVHTYIKTNRCQTPKIPIIWKQNEITRVVICKYNMIIDSILIANVTPAPVMIIIIVINH